MTVDFSGTTVSTCAGEKNAANKNWAGNKNLYLWCANYPRARMMDKGPAPLPPRAPRPRTHRRLGLDEVELGHLDRLVLETGDRHDDVLRLHLVAVGAAVLWAAGGTPKGRVGAEGGSSDLEERAERSSGRR